MIAPPVGIGTSLFLIATGAILKYAVTADIAGVKLDVVGAILLILGIIGLIISLIFLFAYNNRRRGPDEYVDGPPPGEPPRERIRERY